MTLGEIRGFFRIVRITGISASNGLMDLWSEICLLDGGTRLGKTITGYRDRLQKHFKVKELKHQRTLKIGTEENSYNVSASSISMTWT